MTLDEQSELASEVRRCHARIQQLLEANNAEVERRRAVELQSHRLRDALKHARAILPRTTDPLGPTFFKINPILDQGRFDEVAKKIDEALDES